MLIAANWKMNLGKSEIDQFSNVLQSNEFHDRVDACIFSTQCLYKLSKYSN